MRSFLLFITSGMLLLGAIAIMVGSILTFGDDPFHALFCLFVVIPVMLGQAITFDYVRKRLEDHLPG